ncbi:5-hydroxytryptamine receptor 3A-like isoform X2 [Dicentrarchus labrax]|uniref:5-hydroxytryptamine receptor 3A-like isoform X2 n=1 Tax=Dicentrarchus labrax TaxID=13489 RepID=UPI0021F63EE9|nr:5-hydroxytryptamine receptor 3A-like isoform X2 [Dicentrarchus labrax]
MSALKVAAFIALIGISSSQTSDCSYLGLLKHLNLTSTNDVLQIMRPVKNWTTSTLVQVDMLMYGILQVDEMSQTVTSHIWIEMSWMNEFLTWNSSDFCGIEKFTVPMSSLWTPDVSILEDASDTSSIYRSPLGQVSNGWVYVTTRQRLTFTCHMKLRDFPFDTQKSGVMHLGTAHNDTALTRVSEMFMVTRGEWDLVTMEISAPNVTKGGTAQSKLIYTIIMMRKPMLYVVILIVPLFYLMILDLASFFISEARGEKLSFKVTVLLSISVLLLILQDMLPSTEENLPMMAVYCVVTFALVGISLLEAMLVSFLFDLDGYCGQKTRSSVNAQEEIQLEADFDKETASAAEEGQRKPEKSPLTLDRSAGLDALKLILEEVKAARREAEGRETDQRKSRRYRRVAEIIDSVFFVLYFLTVASFLTYIYVVWISRYAENIAMKSD